jgi:hypothetical protein
VVEDVERRWHPRDPVMRLIPRGGQLSMCKKEMSESSQWKHLV